MASSPPIPSLEQMLEGLPLPGGVRPEGLARADLPALITALVDWHPDLAIGEEKHLLGAAFYEEQAAFAGEADDAEARPVRVLLLRDGRELAGILVLEYDSDERAVVGLLSAVSPRCRGRGLGRALIRANERIARGIGAHIVYGLAELDNLPQCASLEQEGQTLCGIVPDSEIRQVAPGVTARVPEGIFLKVLLPPDELFQPEPENLLPRTALLLDLLRSPEAAAAASFAACPQLPLPQIDPALAALVAARPDGTWPDVAVLARQLDLPSGCSVRQLRRQDIPRAASLFADWHPDVVRSSMARLTSASFYEDTVALAGEDQHLASRPAHVWTVERDGEMLGLAAAMYDSQALTLRNGPGAVDPRARQQGLGSRVGLLRVLLARAIGAEALVTWTTLRHRGAQLVAERMGLRLWGLIPASERFAFSPGVIKRGHEALYGVSLLPPEQSRWPDLASLPPHRAAWVRVVRGEASESAS